MTKQKIAFFIDTSETSGGAFTEVVYMLNKNFDYAAGTL